MRIHDEIEELEHQLEQKRLEAARIESLAPDFQLAEALHEATCHTNHTDGCGWFYEKWDNYQDRQYSTKGDYLKRAQKVRSLCPGMSNDEILTVVHAIRGL